MKESELPPKETINGNDPKCFFLFGKMIFWLVLKRENGVLQLPLPFFLLYHTRLYATPASLLYSLTINTYSIIITIINTYSIITTINTYSIITTINTYSIITTINTYSISITTIIIIIINSCSLFPPKLFFLSSNVLGIAK